MSWDILPKANLQYFLQKLKDKFSKVIANPSITTETLTSINIDGTSYDIPAKPDPIVSCSGDGTHPFCRFATLTITEAHSNYPIIFEVSGRTYHFSKILVLFKESSGTDPDINKFESDNDTFYISKVQSGVWDLFARVSAGDIYSDYGTLSVHRISGSGVQKISIQLNCELRSALPSSFTGTSHGGYCARSNESDWASSSGNANTVNNLTVATAVPANAVFTDTKYPKAIKNITRNGTTFTATCYDDTTFTFTQQDNNTQYSAGTGISLSGTTFSNSGVRSIATGSSNGTISVNTNGTSANVSVKGLGNMAYKNAYSYTSSNGWKYYKDFADVYHLHYTSGNISINFNGSIGSLKYRNTTYDINFPVTLSSAYSIQVSALCGNDIVGATIHSYTTSGIKLWLWAAGSGTKTIQIHIDITST